MLASLTKAQSALRFEERRPPQSRDIGQYSPASYGLRGVAQRAGCQSCDRSEWPLSAASNAYHKIPIPNRYFRPSDAPAWHIVGWIGEGAHEFDSGRDIESQ